MDSLTPRNGFEDFRLGSRAASHPMQPGRCRLSRNTAIRRGRRRTGLRSHLPRWGPGICIVLLPPVNNTVSVRCELRRGRTEERARPAGKAAGSADARVGEVLQKARLKTARSRPGEHFRSGDKRDLEVDGIAKQEPLRGRASNRSCGGFGAGKFGRPATLAAMRCRARSMIASGGLAAYIADTRRQAQDNRTPIPRESE
jgi:hypothetical protein